jgi:hypothetical protein
MGQAGRKLVAEKYSIISMVDRTATLYQKLLEKKGIEAPVSTNKNSQIGDK